MTFAEHILAWNGYLEESYIDFSRHRRTAYEIYLSRPRKKGATALDIQKFMPLPIDKVYHKTRSIETIREIHSAVLQKLAKEKQNGANP